MSVSIGMYIGRRNIAEPFISVFDFVSMVAYELIKLKKKEKKKGARKLDGSRLRRNSIEN